ncbi:MAG: YbaK/EbsC family protein [Anaerolineales bacterium]|jgi:prolyl-tRNA editing enzyme YbaK/EbsC (Cys-tRNA(Pro) deacylase)
MILSSAALRVQTALQEQGFSAQIRELPESTRTAAQAARAAGCEVRQIVKSLVFRGKTSGRPVLVETSGANRVSEFKLAPLVGEPVELADPAFVREQTGFSIGGVPPLAHRHPILTLVDADLLSYSTIWAAAGTPNAIFELTPSDLLRMTRGVVASVKA